MKKNCSRFRAHCRLKKSVFTRISIIRDRKMLIEEKFNGIGSGIVYHTGSSSPKGRSLVEYSELIAEADRKMDDCQAYLNIITSVLKRVKRPEYRHAAALVYGVGLKAEEISDSIDMSRCILSNRMTEWLDDAIKDEDIDELDRLAGKMKLEEIRSPKEYGEW